MAEYCKSTQYTSWLLSESSIASRRRAAHESAVAHCTQLHSGNLNAEQTDGDGDGGVSVLTLEEEREVLDHHERRTSALAREFRLPLKVAATTVVYIKRFYLDRSIMMYNPSVVALLALYAATKVEEAPIPACDLVSFADSYLNAGGTGDDIKTQDLSQPQYDGPSKDLTATRVRMDAVLNGELEFLTALNFHLVVFHPYRSLLVIDEKLEASQQKVLTEELRKQILARTRDLVTQRILHSDIPLIHTPGAIAIAATLAAVRKYFPAEYSVVLEALDTPPENSDKVMKLMDAILALPKTGSGTARLVELEKKRLAIRDENMDPTTEAYRKKEAELEEEIDRERRAGMKKVLDDNKRKANELLMGPNAVDSKQPINGSSNAGGTRRSRTDAGLDLGDNDDDDRTRSPVRKRLSLR